MTEGRLFFSLDIGEYDQYSEGVFTGGTYQTTDVAEILGAIGVEDTYLRNLGQESLLIPERPDQEIHPFRADGLDDFYEATEFRKKMGAEILHQIALHNPPPDWDGGGGIFAGIIQYAASWPSTLEDQRSEPLRLAFLPAWVMWVRVSVFNGQYGVGVSFWEGDTND